MDITVYFNSIAQAMLQMFFLGLIGYVMARRKMLSEEGLNGLTVFFIDIVFPALIFWQIISKFRFEFYSNWWMFPVGSLAITALGLMAGYAFGFRIKDPQAKREFVCLTGFQNSGYLPLVLLGWIAPKEHQGTILIYLFLFLLGFNLVIWSWGVYFLSAHKPQRFSFRSLLSSPVMAMLAGFAFVALRITTFIPQCILVPLEMLGNCSFPLAIVVVGASLAELSVLHNVDKKNIFLLVIAKLLALPVLGLVFLHYARVPYLIGLLIILELAVPSATNLAIITRKYSCQERLISQGIFYTHIVSLITLPLFLAAFNLIVMRQ